MSLNATIYVGAWTDWNSNSRALGASLTLTIRQGYYLVAALPFFIAIVEASVWQIICRVAFRTRSHLAQKDALSHQQQAILRNSASDLDALFRFGSTAWAWRRRVRNPIGRSGIFMALAAMNVALFGVAGILSSWIAQPHSNCLLEPTTSCGTWNHDSNPTGDSRLLLAQNIATSQAVNSCVRGATDPSECSPLGRDMIPYQRSCRGINADHYDCNPLNRQLEENSMSIDNSSYCPFDDEVCTWGIVFSLDSGLVDSYEHLGINARKEDRIQYHNNLTCTPITTGHGFTTEDGDRVTYWYGPGTNVSDYTFFHDPPVQTKFGPFLSGRPFEVA